MGRRAARDLPGDPGLVPTRRVSARGPYVGAEPRERRFDRLARTPRLNRLLLELHRGFGWQRWWPAETPFEVLVGAILTQNTAWTNVEKAIGNLKRLLPLTPAALLGADPEALRRALVPSGYFNAKARKLQEICRWYLDAGGLRALCERPLEALRRELLGVWGVGPETADSILCYAAGRRTFVVDAYTRRVVERHGLLAADVPYEELRAWFQERLVASRRVYEEAHALIVRVGYGNCKPRAACDTCPATSPSRRAEIPG